MRELQIELKNVTINAKFNPGNKYKNICAIISHPYGPLGGNLNNNVVVAVGKSLSELGIAILRYDSRGSGGSNGRTTWQGLRLEFELNYSEIEDLIQICDYTTNNLSCSEIILCVFYTS
jgi:alpha/beta superfamily hydrolase